MSQSELSQLVATTRAQLGLTQLELAVAVSGRLGTPRPMLRGAVASWEGGWRVPSPQCLDALGDLAGWDEAGRERAAYLSQRASIARKRGSAA